MKYRNILIGLMIISMLYGCGAGNKRFKEQYPDRPQSGNSRTILQTFVGKPAEALIPYLGKPSDQRLGIWVWGEEKWVYASVNQSNIGPNSIKRSNRDTCQVVANTDDKDVIKSIYFEKNILKRGSVNCPNIGNLTKLIYITNPELYDYDKKHGIVNDYYWIPN